ncbi:MAG: hypothetical protein OXC60_08745 [Litoreibacter sp.]|nr:hypothetical protein [Litoreibacter sp.]MCY4334745.1 hypothetical protein [Litoreibacter sp.]
MTYLTLLLAAKIMVTLATVIVPFLLFKTETLDRLAGFGRPNEAFYRLYGMAILALVVAYSGGLLQTLSGEYPAQIVAMGLASNVGAVCLMIWTGYARVQKALAAFFGLIGIGFLWAALRPISAMLPVWS